MISCMNIKKIIEIDRQMIAKAKITILLNKDFLNSHSATLQDKQLIYVEGVYVP